MIAAAACSPSMATWSVALLTAALAVVGAGLGVWRETVADQRWRRVLELGVRVIVFGACTGAVIFAVAVLAGPS